MSRTMKHGGRSPEEQVAVNAGYLIRSSTKSIGLATEYPEFRTSCRSAAVEESRCGLPTAQPKWSYLPMTAKPPTREDDLRAAREIVGEYGLLIGPAGKQSEIIARAVADGIRLGREQALAKAAEDKGMRKRS